MLGEPVLAASLFRAGGGIAGLSLLQAPPVLPPGSRQAAWPTVVAGLIECFRGPAQLLGSIGRHLLGNPGVEVGQARCQGGERLRAGESVSEDLQCRDLGAASRHGGHQHVSRAGSGFSWSVLGVVLATDRQGHVGGPARLMPT